MDKIEKMNTNPEYALPIIPLSAQRAFIAHAAAMGGWRTDLADKRDDSFIQWYATLADRVYERHRAWYDGQQLHPNHYHKSNVQKKIN